MATSPILNSANIEHQIALVRYSEGRARTLLPFLRDMVSYLEGRLAKEGQTITTKQRLDLLLADTKGRMDAIYSDWESGEFLPALDEVLQNELEFQEASVGAVVDDFEPVLPANKQVMSAAYRNPLLIGAKGGAVDFGAYTKNWKPTEIKRVADRISAGFYSGETVSEITRGIVGLKSQRYADGILNISRANIQGMVKNSISHMSSTAKSEFGHENDDLIIGMRDIATLDSKTSAICRDRDGNVYLFSEFWRNYPRPPYHHGGCRTTQGYELSEEYSFLKESRKRPAVSNGEAQEVPGTQTYYTWLKNQPAAVQDDALGPERGKIFRNAGLSPAEFKNASVNRLREPINIDQMAAKNEKIARYLQNQK